MGLSKRAESVRNVWGFGKSLSEGWGFCRVEGTLAESAVRLALSCGF
jgi:hypothetical protein